MKRRRHRPIHVISLVALVFGLMATACGRTAPRAGALATASCEHSCSAICLHEFACGMVNDQERDACEATCAAAPDSPELRCLAEVFCRDVLRDVNLVCAEASQCLASPRDMDLSIRSFSAFSPDPTTVEYRAEVCNEGSLIAFSFDVGFYLDLDHAPTPSDVPLERSYLFGLKIGECMILHQRIPTHRPHVKAWVKVDSDEIIQESREDNNVGGPVDVKLGEVKDVDLRVSTFGVKVETEGVVFTAELCNIGSKGMIVPSSVDFYEDMLLPPTPSSAPSISRLLSPLAAGHCTEVRVKDRLPVGTYHAWAYVNRSHAVTEANYNNDLSTRRDFTVDQSPYPDFYVKELTVSPGPSSATFTAKICNQGVATSTWTSLDIFVQTSKPDATSLRMLRVSVPPLGARGCVGVEAKQSIGLGSHVAWGWVNRWNPQPEAQTGNNIIGPRSFTVGVTPAKACELACELLVTPCQSLPKGHQSACVTNCKSLPASIINCAYKAYQARDCSAVDQCVFS
ncbi:MAG: hypothetical protein KAI47_15280 [Deltaproteobacteria bacterium]|nr:hypothetical protein [Deltaproteobacteria bacterium]